MSDDSNVLPGSIRANRTADLTMTDKEWRPIDSAPKHTPVLAWQKGHAVYIAEWDDGQWWTDSEDFNDSARHFPPTCYPALWQPLPKPPEAP